jgi:hypothetical protein
MPEDLKGPPSLAQSPGLADPSREKNPAATTTTSAIGSSPLSARPSLPSLVDQDELVAKKKSLVQAFDQIVEPLREILALMKRYQWGVAIVILVLVVVSGLSLHTTIRLAAIEEQLAIVVSAQQNLQVTVSSAASAAATVERQTASLSQVTIEPAETPSGTPTAVVVVHPAPRASASVKPVVLPLPTAAPVASGRMKTRHLDASLPAPSDVILKFEP